MFRKLHDFSGKQISIEIDGERVIVEAGETVAAVLLRQPEPWSRQSSISGVMRGPYCMMGVCFDCLAEVDGISSTQTCLVTVREGMRVARQRGTRRITP